MTSAQRGSDFERCLVAGLQVADESSVRALVATFGPLVFQQARRRVLNYEDAEEITQDVLVTVIQRISGFRKDAALASWIYRITFNTSLTYLRARRRLKRRGRTVPLDRTYDDRFGSSRWSPSAVLVADSRPTQEERLARQQQRQLVNRALAELSPPMRRALVLHYARGMSVRQAGAILRVSPKTVRTRLFRGRQLLRARLAAPSLRPRAPGPLSGTRTAAGASGRGVS